MLIIIVIIVVIRNVMNHMSHHFNLFEATHFVLSGTSAGGFGVKMILVMMAIRLADVSLLDLIMFRMTMTASLNIYQIFIKYS